MNTDIRQDFINAVEKVNKLAPTELRINPTNAVSLFEKEISPCGYPSNQALLLDEIERNWRYNDFISRYPTSPTGKPREFKACGVNKEAVEIPTYFITDELANALVHTKLPERVIQLDLDVLPKFEVVFSNKYKFFKRISIGMHGTFEDKKTLTIEVTYVHQGHDVCFQYELPCSGVGQCGWHDVFRSAFEELYEFNYLNLLLSPQFKEIGNPKVEAEDIKEQCTHVYHDFIQTRLSESVHFVINLYQLLTIQPEIITVRSSSTQHIATAKKGFSAVKVKTAPKVHWLGETFTNRVVYESPEGENAGGHSTAKGAPKKSHWRRGHWHTVRQGPGRKQTQVKWFRPAFIKGNAA